MKRIGFHLSVIFLSIVIPYSAYAQMDDLHGNVIYIKKGEHSGNLFHLTFYNDGTLGTYENDPEDFAGEWPKGSGHRYLMDGNVFVGSQLIDSQGIQREIITEVRGYGGSTSRGDQDEETGEWLTFLPLPGFANPLQVKAAMSKWPDSWPGSWPDKFDDPLDPGWSGKWNGYFGKDVKNADEESYFVSDDYNNDEDGLCDYFFPDSNDTDRKGLGVRMYFRGFQWSNVLVEDGLFVLFDLENIGTFHHDKVVFGYKFGNNMGDTRANWDSDDDMGAFNRDEDVAYLYDYDDVGAADWGSDPVGYFGGAFLESPGSSYDGIDNDGDGSDGAGPTIDQSMFEERILQAGEQVVVINYNDFERSVINLPGSGISIQYQNTVLHFAPGDTVQEIPHNLIDDNLNGIIDESNGVDIGGGVYTYLNIGLKYIDYLTGNGQSNELLDERRDDGIDNDRDWNSIIDDVGQDGVRDSYDVGEGDGVPTEGEPHFDKTDIDETDMLGLTSFDLYDWQDMPHYRDDLVWPALKPGGFDTLMENDNIELLYGSGYFPMPPGEIQRFSMGIMCGFNLDDFMENKYWFAFAYNENYNFAQAPPPPNLKAIAGDGKVTLVWDDIAEYVEDPICMSDFEGYRIYRSTDPGFNDPRAITDGRGNPTYIEPLVQYDIDNEYEGYAEYYVKGIHFWLGKNTGLQHSFTDTTVTNGFTYYYAITSYDHGCVDTLTGVPFIPSECPRQLSIKPSGEIEKGVNVVIVRPEAPSAGYVPASIDSVNLLPGGTGTGKISYKIIDPDEIKDNNKYRITFEDTVISNYPLTKSITLIDMNNPDDPDTLINKSRQVSVGYLFPATDGFRLSVKNDSTLEYDEEESGWNRDDIYNYTVTLPARGTPRAADYKIEFGEVGIDTSTQERSYDSVPVNFKITNVTENKQIDFVFMDRGVEDSVFNITESSPDRVLFLEEDENGELGRTWAVYLQNSDDDSLRTAPGLNDYLDIKFKKPFLSHDILEFVTFKPNIDKALAKKDLDKIRVVPNPYIATNSWEPHNPYSTGRGERHLHFIHLPSECTIKIFTVSGQIVQTLEHRHDSELQNGTEIWDMLTKDNLDIAYGLYIYHVDAPGIGEKIGKFAVIK